VVIEIEDVWLCEECDTVMPKQPLHPGERVYCPNCKHNIAEKSRYSFHVPLALSITGLLLLLPACLLPLIHMEVFADVTNHSIISGIADFLQQGTWLPAILIFLGTVVIPFIYLFLNTFILISLISGKSRDYLIKTIKLFTHIKYWGMLEVYLLGIFISIIKLGDVAKVYPGLGLVALIGLILCQTLITLIVKPSMLWNALSTTRNSQKETV